MAQRRRSLLISIRSFFERSWTWIERHKIFAGFSFMLVSVLGGLPGGCSLYDRITRSPEFEFHADAVFPGTLGDPFPHGRTLLLVGGMFNNGEQTLFPEHFRLRAEWKGGSYMETDAYPLTDTLMKLLNQTSNLSIRTGKSTKDLMQVDRLTSYDVSHGLLYFLYNYIGPDLGKPDKLILICKDIRHREYRAPIKDFDRFVSFGNGYIPKSDVEIR